LKLRLEPTNLETLARRADDLYLRRGEPGAVEQSVSVLTNSQGADREYELQWRLARALFFLGQQAEPRDSKRRLHAAAVSAGERAARLSPERVEGHFWLGVNLALLAEATGGGFGAARAVLRARAALRRAARISESYHGAGPLRVLARLEHKAPWFVGGGRRRSRSYFDRALRLAPSNSVTLLYAAELAADQGEPDRARALLERAAAADVDPEWEFENRRDREIARSLLGLLG
jgi:tetratricopeptide (TPR) repeat protein